MKKIVNFENAKANNEEESKGKVDASENTVPVMPPYEELVKITIDGYKNQCKLPDSYEFKDYDEVLNKLFDGIRDGKIIKLPTPQLAQITAAMLSQNKEKMKELDIIRFQLADSIEGECVSFIVEPIIGISEETLDITSDDIHSLNKKLLELNLEQQYK